MLNKVIIMGRITHDLEVKYTPSGIQYLTFSVAVQRNFAKQGEERQTDFISCVAWRQQAEFIAKYFDKGRMICIEGALRTRTYDDKNGTKHYVTEVFVNGANFTGEPKPQQQQNNAYQNNGYQQNSGYQQQPYVSGNNPVVQPEPEPPSNDALSIGDLSDFEEIINDGGVPF